MSSCISNDATKSVRLCVVLILKFGLFKQFELGYLALSDDIFEKVSDDAKDILEEVSVDGDEIFFYWKSRKIIPFPV